MKVYPDQLDCPRCQSVGYKGSIPGIPKAMADSSGAHYVCLTCGFSYDVNKKALIRDASELKNISIVAEKTGEIIEDTPELKELNPAAKALFKARIAEHAVTIWFDGFKQGLLCDALSQAWVKKQNQGEENGTCTVSDESK